MRVVNGKNKVTTITVTAEELKKMGKQISKKVTSRVLKSRRELTYRIWLRSGFAGEIFI